MKINLRLIYVVVLNLFYLDFMIYWICAIWTRNVPWYFSFLVMAMFFRLPTMVTAYSRYLEEPDNFSLDLAIHPVTNQKVTPEFIAEILRNENVIQVIRNDLRKTGQIGYREEWRLGLIKPGQDLLSPCLIRTAILHSAEYIKPNNIAITHGEIRPLGFDKWTYGVSTQLSQGELIHFRSIRLADDSRFCAHSLSFPEFLRENGFPLKASYPDGDPLSTDRVGTIVLDRGKLIVIYPHYFVQRRLIDDEGNILDLGIDEDLYRRPTFSVKLVPSVSSLLIRRVSSKGYIPVVRYHSVPYASDTMLPLLDTPMSANGWADLYIDTRGKGKLFIAKEKTEAEWVEMMNRLKTLFFTVLANKGNHLLSLTKDQGQMDQYFYQKLNILAGYYHILDWNFCER